MAVRLNNDFFSSSPAVYNNEPHNFRNTSFFEIFFPFHRF